MLWQKDDDTIYKVDKNDDKESESVSKDFIIILKRLKEYYSRQSNRQTIEANLALRRARTCAAAINMMT